MSKNKVVPCGVCCLIAKANTGLCLQCGKLIHGRCARVKKVTTKFSRTFTCRKYGGNIGEAVEQEERLCDEMETASEFTYYSINIVTG